MLDFVNLSIGIAAHRCNIENLCLVVEALLAIVRQATDLKDDDLRNFIHEIDAKDGKYDGRNTKNTAIVQCARCGKTLLKGQTSCAYCGEPIPDGGNFRHAGQ